MVSSLALWIIAFFFLLVMNSKSRPVDKSDYTIVFLDEVILPSFGLECSSTNGCISTAEGQTSEMVEGVGWVKGQA